jgi:predicted nucleic acid-binding protein
MKYVVDACVAFKWLVPEVDTDKALRLRDDYRAGIHQLLAPDFFPIEIAHSLTRAERQGRITPAQGALLLTDLLKALPQLHPSLAVLPRAYAISSQAKIGAYDCAYVALAEQEGCQFVTSDDRLIRNLQPLFPSIIALASLP